MAYVLFLAIVAFGVPLALSLSARVNAEVRTQAQAQADLLPSWNDGPSKRAITDFVARVTLQGGPDFVPPAA